MSSSSPSCVPRKDAHEPGAGAFRAVRRPALSARDRASLVGLRRIPGLRPLSPPAVATPRGGRLRGRKGLQARRLHLESRRGGRRGRRDGAHRRDRRPQRPPGESQGPDPERRAACARDGTRQRLPDGRLGDGARPGPTGRGCDRGLPVRLQQGHPHPGGRPLQRIRRAARDPERPGGDADRRADGAPHHRGAALRSDGIRKPGHRRGTRPRAEDGSLPGEGHRRGVHP